VQGELRLLLLLLHPLRLYQLLHIQTPVIDKYN
jgi:hypothetical protein